MVPSSRPWQKPPVRRKGGRAGLPARVSGRHVVRGRQSSRAPRGTGKAGENGQNSGEVGGSSAWTRPSAPSVGDTLKALAGDQRRSRVGSSSKTAPGSLSTGVHRPSYSSRTETAQCTVRPT